MTEGWLPVVGYEGLYEVSSLGRVRSLRRAVVTRDRWCKARINQRRARIMKLQVRKGYAGVCLTDGSGRQKIWRVNRLVLLAWVGEPPSEDATLACHRDGITMNNDLDNLYWGTPQQNMDDCVDHGNRPRGEQCQASKLTEDQVREIRKKLNRYGAVYTIAKEYNVTGSTISAIKYNRIWRHVV